MARLWERMILFWRRNYGFNTVFDALCALAFSFPVESFPVPVVFFLFSCVLFFYLTHLLSMDIKPLSLLTGNVGS
jgi:hypothetical protein